ncbi:MAG: GNAT family N-acetyltransferase [Oscillospiraceae bacterium]|nr:GNAT family N-acetyltransferase [Oscillospiraceae bacterium]
MNKITIRQALTGEEVNRFWQQLNEYHIRDIFPDPDSEDLEYFLGNEYRTHMEKIRSREHDRCYYLFFDRDGDEIGFCLPVLYDTEDGKCFLMEFCVYPEFRGNGTGKACADAFLEWTKIMDVSYVEINCDSEQRMRFWSRCGFVPNGRDEWGVPLMIRKPEENVPITVEKLIDPEDWQLLKLMNGYFHDIGEDCLTEEKQEQLQQAIKEGRITFFLAKRGYRAVGMCSVVKSFSTFCCGDVATFEDFYIEPVFRKQGIARMLCDAAQSWCREQGTGSLSVTSAPCDEEMYCKLGFDVLLGKTYVYITNQTD